MNPADTRPSILIVDDTHENLVTANAMAGDREKCLKAGMNDPVAKPVIPQNLYRALSLWVQGRSADSSPSTAHSETTTGTDPHFNHLIPLLKGVDTAVGLYHAGGNSELYKKVLKKFARNQVNACQTMQKHLQSHDASAIERIAHSLKGVAATIGAQKLAGLAGQIEHLSKLQGDFSAIENLIQTTAMELMQIIRAVDTAFHEDLLPIAETVSDHKMGANELKPLFVQAVKLLETFDSSVEKVVAQLDGMAQDECRRTKMKAVNEALSCYDFVSCLDIFRKWATEEQIEL
ncbi:MAG: Hpt domain-containing protein [Magnetococcus sp. YQC-5]